MPKTIEELEKLFTETQTQVSVMKKDFELKLDSANKTAKEYQELATAREEDLRKYKQEKEATELKHKQDLAKSRETEISEFVEAQCKAGKIIPAFKERLTAFMKSLTSESEVMKFTEADGSTRTHTQISLFKELLSKILKPVMPLEEELSTHEQFSETTEEGEDASKKTHFTEINVGGEKKRVQVDEVDIAAKAYKFQDEQKKLGRDVTYEDALIAVYPKKRPAVKA